MCPPLRDIREKMCQLWDQGSVALLQLAQEVGEQGGVSHHDASHLEPTLSGSPLPFTHSLGGCQHWSVSKHRCPGGMCNIRKHLLGSQMT